MSPFRPQTIVPPDGWVPDEPAHVVEEFLERHVGRFVRGVVEEGRAPQAGVGSEYHAVQRGQAFLGRVQRQQAEVFADLPVVPWLVLVVTASHVVSTWKSDKWNV